MMPLRPQTIGRDMSHGFSGSYARQPDMIVTTAPLGGAEDIPCLLYTSPERSERTRA